MWDMPRSRAQHYQNTFAFKHNPKSRKTKKILGLQSVGLCERCERIIEWRKKYRKYKMLTVMARCVRCNQKNISQAYHSVCAECAGAKSICCKCLGPLHSSEVGQLLFAEEGARTPNNTDDEQDAVRGSLSDLGISYSDNQNGDGDGDGDGDDDGDDELSVHSGASSERGFSSDFDSSAHSQ